MVHDAPALPTAKSQCTNGGWKTFDGAFKNQGQCLAFVERSQRTSPYKSWALWAGSTARIRRSGIGRHTCRQFPPPICAHARSALPHSSHTRIPRRPGSSGRSGSKSRRLRTPPCPPGRPPRLGRALRPLRRRRPRLPIRRRPPQLPEQPGRSESALADLGHRPGESRLALRAYHDQAVTSDQRPPRRRCRRAGGTRGRAPPARAHPALGHPAHQKGSSATTLPRRDPGPQAGLGRTADAITPHLSFPRHADDASDRARGAGCVFATLADPLVRRSGPCRAIRSSGAPARSDTRPTPVGGRPSVSPHHTRLCRRGTGAAAASTRCADVRRLQPRHSGPAYRDGSPSTCPKSQGWPSRSGAPHRAQRTPPAAIALAHRCLSLRCGHPYRSWVTRHPLDVQTTGRGIAMCGGVRLVVVSDDGDPAPPRVQGSGAGAPGW